MHVYVLLEELRLTLFFLRWMLYEEEHLFLTSWWILFLPQICLVLFLID
jgi:hypothetical protein